MATTPLNYFQTVPASPGGAATGSTSGQQSGFGITGSFVPSSPAALITISGTLANGTASGGGSVKISIGAGPAPALGAAPTGGAGYPVSMVNNANSAGMAVPFTLQTVVNGLVPGLGYWIDMQIEGSGTGTCTPGNILITALGL